MKVVITSFLIIMLSTVCYAQNYSKKDSIRGSITPERSWWDLSYYELDIKEI